MLRVTLRWGLRQGDRFGRMEVTGGRLRYAGSSSVGCLLSPLDERPIGRRGVPRTETQPAAERPSTLCLMEAGKQPWLIANQQFERGHPVDDELVRAHILRDAGDADLDRGCEAHQLPRDPAPSAPS